MAPTAAPAPAPVQILTPQITFGIGGGVFNTPANGGQMPWWGNAAAAQTAARVRFAAYGDEGAIVMFAFAANSAGNHALAYSSHDNGANQHEIRGHYRQKYVREVV